MNPVMQIIIADMRDVLEEAGVLAIESNQPRWKELVNTKLIMEGDKGNNGLYAAIYSNPV